MTNADDIMFSVEVPTYNQKEYVGQALQSIIDQKHNYRYEILVSDDCSTDGTQDIIKEYAKKYPDIIKPVYNEKNLGAMANYYATVARAKGKYLMGCGGDDYWLPGKVEKQIEFMERNSGFSICYSKAFCNSNGITSARTVGENARYQKDFINNNYVPALTSCIRMSFFNNYISSIKPQSRNWFMEDYPLNIYAAFNSYIYCFDEVFAVYRVLEGSVSHSQGLKKAFSFSKNVYEIRLFFSKLYNVDIENWDDSQKLRQIYNAFCKKSNNKFSIRQEYINTCKELSIKPKNNFSIYHILKKVIKYLLPYFFSHIYGKINCRRKIKKNV